MEKIVINRENCVVDDSWMIFNKVRGIIKISNSILLSIEGGKYIFPGGKIDKNEDVIEGFKREIEEETGIILEEKIIPLLELETYYTDFYDFRSDSLKPRYTKTTYFYVETDKNINLSNQKLTEDEIKEKFSIFRVDENKLYACISEKHDDVTNGKFFDEENKIVYDFLIRNKIITENSK